VNDQSLALAARRPPLIALALLGAALLLVFGTSGGEARNRNGGLGPAVQSLVDAGWFTLDKTRDAIVLAPDPETGTVDPARKSFVSQVHRLGDYMEEPAYWQLDDAEKVIGFSVNDSVPSPFENRNTWAGDMLFGRVPAINVIPLVRLADSRGRIGLTADPDLSLDRRTLWPRLDVGRPGAEEVSGGVFELMCGSEPGAMLYRIADAVVVNARARGRCGVHVGEQRLGDAGYCQKRHIPAGRCAFGVLRPGDVLAFTVPGAAGERVIARYQRRAPPSAAMVMRRNAADDRIPASGLGGFVEAAWYDLSNALRGCSSGESSSGLNVACDENLRLSFDYEMQQEVQHWLDADRAAQAKRKIPSTAAIAVMNATSGEVLAMGGYQAPESETCPIPALCLLPVGSTAKPVFATAMLGGYEGGNLTTLTIRHRGKALNDILGLGFKRSANNENTGTAIGAPVDLPRFIQLSDNHYIETLMLLSSPVRNGGKCAMAPDDWYEIDGKRVTGERPRSAFEDEACRPLRAGYQAPFHSAWADKLADYFALTPYGRDSVDADTLCSGRMYGNMTYDAMVWSSMFLPDADHCQMIRSGLQRNWMRIDHMRDFRTEAIPLLLGNNGGHWSVIKLAEAYSRLATGKAVRASFLYLAGAPVSKPIDFTSHGIDVRVPVSAGMARVPEGTAASSLLPAALADLERKLADKHYRLGVFAKTGTMQLAGAMAKGCRGEADQDECVGKAYAMTLAVYPDSVAADDATGRVMDAAAKPRCAITIVVNLPRWNGELVAGNPAANVAESLVRGTIGARLLEVDGAYCGPRN